MNWGIIKFNIKNSSSIILDSILDGCDSNDKNKR